MSSRPSSWTIGAHQPDSASQPAADPGRPDAGHKIVAKRLIARAGGVTLLELDLILDAKLRRARGRRPGRRG